MIVDGHLHDVVDRVRDLDLAGTTDVVLDTIGSTTVDPFVVASAVAQATDRVRITVAVPVTEWHPYLIARRLAAVDKIADGRLRWWPVDADATRRAESADIVAALLTSWPADVVLNDRASGIQVDTDRVTRVMVQGNHFTVDSPLDVPRGPQGVVPHLDPFDGFGVADPPATATSGTR
ncbi:hypothetical protein GS4_45_00280 [Gordonia soli NBRC 108243]|uniref:Luciferase-like domain-containing protein n=1 Tax=Gordonia soli NBRC 108243 TaxID=1223545 RepID=M0QS78_9ACTN|nr:hypothetical protein GS4_45_00280 [Gordonia soli NBRC 108243]